MEPYFIQGLSVKMVTIYSGGEYSIISWMNVNHDNIESANILLFLTSGSVTTRPDHLQYWLVPIAEKI